MNEASSKSRYTFSLKQIIKVSLIFVFIYLHNFSFSQNNGINNSPINRSNLFKNIDEIHTNLLPLVPGFNSFSKYDTSISILLKHKDVTRSIGNFRFEPILDLKGGVSTKSDPIYKGAAGMKLQWNRKNKWHVEGKYAYISESPESYLFQLQDSLGVLYGVGYADNRSDLLYGHYYTGKVIYNATDYFSFEVGRDKHFWGDGYRSLILSNNSSPYPYFKINTRAWKIHYVNLWTQMREKNSNGFNYKYMAMHALSWNVRKRWNVSLYETVIWQNEDGSNRRGLDINYLNPVIFYRPVEHSIGSADNELVGLSFSYKYKDHTKFYFQILLDEFLLKEIKARNGWWANKFAVQVGTKSYDIFNSGIDFQSELNFARPFTYTHGSVLQNFGHERQSLAHPLETNFVEWVTLLEYTSNKWSVNNEFVWAIYGRDEHDQNLGGNLYESYSGVEKTYDNYLAQGSKTTLISNETTFDYYFRNNKSIAIGLTNLCRYEAQNSKNEFNNYILLHVRINPILRNIIR